jgi:acetylornithine deacetylase/succinyl-diaminopimelate desuccinylase family protein
MTQSLIASLDDAYTRRVLSEMISTPSVVGQEKALVEYLYSELEALGLQCEMQEVERERPNVYAKLPGDGPGKRLNLNGHTDTVPVVDGWDSDPFTPVEKDGKLYGLGACDMKAGIACVLNVIRAFIRSGQQFNGELSFSGVIDEEAYGKGAKAMLQTEYAAVDAIVLAEPYPGDETKPIPLGITGKILYDIHVHGKAAHGFRPHLGVNAVEEAAKIVASLDRLHFRHHPDFGVGNTCTLKIEGGYEVYSVLVPARCRFEVNRLLVPGEAVETAIGDMEELVGDLNLASEVEIRTKPPAYEPYVMKRSDPILRVFDQAYRDVMGVAPLYEYARGITDANIFAGEGGIPCLHLGPQRGGAHQKNEYVPLDWLPRVSQIFAIVAARFLGAA